MQKLTIGRMARLYGMHRSSLYEAVEKGRVSVGFDGKGQRVIDLSEMIRVYGEPPGKPEAARQNPTPQTDTDPTPPTDALQPLLEELQAMRRELVALREEVAQLRTLPAPGQLAQHDDHHHPEPQEGGPQSAHPLGEGVPKSGTPRDECTPPERPRKAQEGTQASTPSDDDPHGFRALVRAMRESGQQ